MDKQRQKLTLRNITSAAMFLTTLIVSAQIKISFPLLPLTLQTMFVFLSAMINGSYLSAFTVLVYILMGLAGLPVFASGGGLVYLVSPTFGYLIGFFISSLLVGKAKNRLASISFTKLWLLNMAGLTVIYICGFSYAAILYFSGIFEKEVLAYYLSITFIVTLIADIIKSLAASFAAKKIAKSLRHLSGE